MDPSIPALTLVVQPLHSRAEQSERNARATKVSRENPKKLSNIIILLVNSRSNSQRLDNNHSFSPGRREWPRKATCIRILVSSLIRCSSRNLMSTAEYSQVWRVGRKETQVYQQSPHASSSRHRHSVCGILTKHASMIQQDWWRFAAIAAGAHQPKRRCGASTVDSSRSTASVRM